MIDPKMIALKALDLVAEFNIYNKDTAEHQKKRDEILDNFVKDITGVSTLSGVNTPYGKCSELPYS